MRKRIETEFLAISKSKNTEIAPRQIHPRANLQAIYISSSKLISSHTKYRWLVYPIYMSGFYYRHKEGPLPDDHLVRIPHRRV